ncbi:MAG: tetraacyldisaccharide 4'-kinase [Verrucomicrobiales bacterium]|nr:tetraacyldisaccharide 4'-kinase [Verrucomicrobiales bacterium]
MKEGFEQFAVEVITGVRKGLRAGTLRLMLGGLSFIYRGAVGLRLWLYRNRILREKHLGCMVVSIGNLTVGGTGKTPVVEMFARALSAGGRRVAILSRGYKSEAPPKQRLRDKLTGRRQEPPPRVVSDGTGPQPQLDSRIAGDEPFMLAQNLPGVAVVVDKNRVKAGRHAIGELGADTLLLDDGLQYLKLRHRLDIVLVDRQAPFGNEWMLPRGFLREPPRNLRRASYIFITKCDAATPNDDLIRRIRRFNRTAEIIECRHAPLHLTHLVTREQRPLDFLQGRNIATISGIARPESFEGGLEQLGSTIRFTRRFTDHHRYTESEITEFILRADDRGVDFIVTTEKDSVRFPDLSKSLLPVYFLRVEIEILTGQENWESCVQRICQPHPVIPAQRWF